MVDRHRHVGSGRDTPGSKSSGAFLIAIALNTGYSFAELILGLMLGSLALVADSAHNFGDVLSLVLAWWATRLAATPPTARRTYGMRRSTVLAALANAVLLLVAVGGMSWEAVSRLRAGAEPVNGLSIVWVAFGGIVVNAVSALLFRRDKDVNRRAAFLHLATDAAVSLGVVLAGLAIHATGWNWLDPAVSLAVGAAIAFSTVGLFRESLNLALDAVPEGVDPAEVDAFLRGQSGVADVHDLHIWALGTEEVALTAHLVAPNRDVGDADLSRISRELHERFGIEHSTLQVEQEATMHSCGKWTL